MPRKMKIKQYLSYASQKQIKMKFIQNKMKNFMKIYILNNNKCKKTKITRVTTITKKIVF